MTQDDDTAHCDAPATIKWPHRGLDNDWQHMWLCASHYDIVMDASTSRFVDASGGGDDCIGRSLKYSE